MHDDIVPRLRSAADEHYDNPCMHPEDPSPHGAHGEICHAQVMTDAANEIEQLQAELADWQRTVRAMSTNDNNPPKSTNTDIINQLSYYMFNEARMPAGFTRTIIEEIERLNEQTKLWKQTAGAWQATAAGLTQDISNAEDQIEQLQNEIQQLQTRKLSTPNSISGQHHQDAHHTNTYGILIHDTTDNNTTEATVIYRGGVTNEEGPWHPITTCHPDWAWDILNALQEQQ